MSRPWTERLLGREPQQRARNLQQLLTLPFVWGAVLLGSGVSLWLQVPTLLWLSWALLELGFSVLFTTLVRCGWSARRVDPLLLLPQMLVGTALAAWAYLMVGPYRVLVVPGLMVVLLFGMFQLPTRDGLKALGFALLCMLLASAAGLRWLGFAWADELIHFGVLLLCLPATSALAVQMSKVRHRLERQTRRLNEALGRIEQLATRDALTGLPNRREGERLLQQALAGLPRHGRPLALAMLDLDHFKQINDQHGHAAGDAVLQALATTAGQQLRGHDQLVRWGGEEFLLLLEGDGVAALARLQQAVREAPVRLGDGRSVAYDFSAGLSPLRAGERAEDALARADALLYQAKQDGRGRVVRDPLAEAGTVTPPWLQNPQPVPQPPPPPAPPAPP
jgi:diguanylate cyclase